MYNTAMSNVEIRPAAVLVAFSAVASGLGSASPPDSPVSPHHVPVSPHGGLGPNPLSKKEVSALREALGGSPDRLVEATPPVGGGHLARLVGSPNSKRNVAKTISTLNGLPPSETGEDYVDADTGPAIIAEVSDSTNPIAQIEQIFHQVGFELRDVTVTRDPNTDLASTTEGSGQTDNNVPTSFETRWQAISPDNNADTAAASQTGDENTVRLTPEEIKALFPATGELQVAGATFQHDSTNTQISIAFSSPDASGSEQEGDQENMIFTIKTNGMDGSTLRAFWETTEGIVEFLVRPTEPLFGSEGLADFVDAVKYATEAFAAVAALIRGIPKVSKVIRKFHMNDIEKSFAERQKQLQFVRERVDQAFLNGDIPPALIEALTGASKVRGQNGELNYLAPPYDPKDRDYMMDQLIYAAERVTPLLGNGANRTNGVTYNLIPVVLQIPNLQNPNGQKRVVVVFVPDIKQGRASPRVLTHVDGKLGFLGGKDVLKKGRAPAPTDMRGFVRRSAHTMFGNKRLMREVEFTPVDMNELSREPTRGYTGKLSIESRHAGGIGGPNVPEYHVIQDSLRPILRSLSAAAPDPFGESEPTPPSRAQLVESMYREIIGTVVSDIQNTDTIVGLRDALLRVFHRASGMEGSVEPAQVADLLVEIFNDDIDRASQTLNEYVEIGRKEAQLVPMPDFDINTALNDVVIGLVPDAMARLSLIHNPRYAWAILTRQYSNELDALTELNPNSILSNADLEDLRTDGLEWVDTIVDIAMNNGINSRSGLINLLRAYHLHMPGDAHQEIGETFDEADKERLINLIATNATLNLETIRQDRAAARTVVVERLNSAPLPRNVAAHSLRALEEYLSYLDTIQLGRRDALRLKERVTALRHMSNKPSSDQYSPEELMNETNALMRDARLLMGLTLPLDAIAREDITRRYNTLQANTQIPLHAQRLLLHLYDVFDGDPTQSAADAFGVAYSRLINDLAYDVDNLRNGTQQTQTIDALPPDIQHFAREFITNALRTDRQSDPTTVAFDLLRELGKGSHSPGSPNPPSDLQTSLSDGDRELVDGRGVNESPPASPGPGFGEKETVPAGDDAAHALTGDTAGGNGAQTPLPQDRRPDNNQPTADALVKSGVLDGSTAHGASTPLPDTRLEAGDTNQGSNLLEWALTEIGENPKETVTVAAALLLLRWGTGGGGGGPSDQERVMVALSDGRTATITTKQLNDLQKELLQRMRDYIQSGGQATVPEGGYLSFIATLMGDGITVDMLDAYYRQSYPDSYTGANSLQAGWPIPTPVEAQEAQEAQKAKEAQEAMLEQARSDAQLPAESAREVQVQPSTHTASELTPGSSYVVQTGDTLYGIGMRNGASAGGTSLNYMQIANGLLPNQDNSLSPGQQLYLPDVGTIQAIQNLRAEGVNDTEIARWFEENRDALVAGTLAGAAVFGLLSHLTHRAGAAPDRPAFQAAAASADEAPRQGNVNTADNCAATTGAPPVMPPAQPPNNRDDKRDESPPLPPGAPAAGEQCQPVATPVPPAPVVVVTTPTPDQPSVAPQPPAEAPTQQAAESGSAPTLELQDFFTHQESQIIIEAGGIPASIVDEQDFRMYGHRILNDYYEAQVVEYDEAPVVVEDAAPVVEVVVEAPVVEEGSLAHVPTAASGSGNVTEGPPGGTGTTTSAANVTRWSDRPVNPYSQFPTQPQSPTQPPGFEVFTPPAFSGGPTVLFDFQTARSNGNE